MIFDRSTFKRVVLEGHRHWCYRGPYRVNPYGDDPRNGAWSFGALQAKRGFSEKQAWKAFVSMEYERGPENGFKELPNEPEPQNIEIDAPDLIPQSSRKYFT